MANFPTITGGGVTKVPTQRAVDRGIFKVFFADDTEQRWRTRLPVSRFQLRFTHVSGRDVELIRKFFQDAKGAQDQGWSIVFDGVTYNNCGFDQDDFPIAEPPDFVTFYDFILLVRQNVPG